MSLRALYSGVKRIFARPQIIPVRHAQSATHTSNLPPWSPATLVIRDLEIQCGDPIFSVVRGLAAVKPGLRFSQLDPVIVAEPQLPNAQQWKWISIAEATDFAELVTRLETSGVAIAHRPLESFTQSIEEEPKPDDPPQPPTWLVMHILCNQTESLSSILVALKLVYYHLPATAPEFRPAMLIMTAVRLAQLRVVAPFRQLTKRFLQLPSLVTSDHFNLMIRAVTLFPQSQEVSRICIGLVHVALSRKFTLTEQTYDALLSPGVLTISIAKAVEDAMHRQGFKPTLHHLRRLLRMSSLHHRSDNAEKYLNRITAQSGESDATRKTSEANSDIIDNSTSDRVAYISSLKEPRKAYEYLEKLNRAAARAQLAGKRRVGTNRTRSKLDSHVSVKPGATFTVHDWIAGLQVAARSEQATPTALLSAFRKGVHLFGDQINMFAYDVVIRGLVHKWAIAQAMELWDECRRYPRKLRVGTLSLGTGVVVLTLHGEPHNAFKLLEHARRRQKERESRDAEREPGARGRWGGPSVNLKAVNQFMLALHRVGRPNVVFALWDNMEVLYGLRPDTYSLNILLQAARWSVKYNITIRGALAYLGLGVEHYDGNEVDVNSRKLAVKTLKGLLSPDLKHTNHSLWNGESAARCALRIAVHMLLSNWPHLRRVHSPIKPTPPSAVIRSLVGPSDEPAVSPLLGLADELPESQMYLQIVPTDVTFRAILDHLELHDLASEVPLVLAWMYALRIVPSKDTLATALVYWSSVPNADRWGGRQHSYNEFYKWLHAWVGESKMPTADEMSSTFRRLRYFNERTRADITAAHIEKAESQMKDAEIDMEA